MVDSVEHYLNLAERFKGEQLPYGTQWREVEAYREKLVAAKEYQWVNFREQKYLLKLQSEAEQMAKLSH